MKDDNLVVKPKKAKGEDGYKTFSIRIKEETITKIVQDDVEIFNKKKALDVEKELEYKRQQLLKLKQELGED